MNNYKLTSIGLILSTTIYLVCVIFDFDLFEKLVVLLANLEKFELDEIIIPLFIFLIFISLDKRKHVKDIELENEKLKIYKAMLSSSHHIINNFIYQMDIFKHTADDTPGFDAKILAFYEDIIDNASNQINSLSNLSTIDEFSIRASVMMN